MLFSPAQYQRPPLKLAANTLSAYPCLKLYHNLTARAQCCLACLCPCPQPCLPVCPFALLPLLVLLGLRPLKSQALLLLLLMLTFLTLNLPLLGPAPQTDQRLSRG